MSKFQTFSGVICPQTFPSVLGATHTTCATIYTLCWSSLQPMATTIADLSTYKRSLLWDVGVVSSISTLGVGLSSTHRNFGPYPIYFGMTLLCERRCDLAFGIPLAFIFHFRSSIVTFQHSQNGSKPSDLWLGQSVVLMDSRPWKLRPPPWDHNWNCEMVALWELRGLL